MAAQCTIYIKIQTLENKKLQSFAGFLNNLLVAIKPHTSNSEFDPILMTTKYSFITRDANLSSKFLSGQFFSFVRTMSGQLDNFWLIV